MSTRLLTFTLSRSDSQSTDRLRTKLRDLRNGALRYGDFLPAGFALFCSIDLGGVCFFSFSFAFDLDLSILLYLACSLVGVC